MTRMLSVIVLWMMLAPLPVLGDQPWTQPQYSDPVSTLQWSGSARSTPRFRPDPQLDASGWYGEPSGAEFYRYRDAPELSRGASPAAEEMGGSSTWRPAPDQTSQQVEHYRFRNDPRLPQYPFSAAEPQYRFRPLTDRERTRFNQGEPSWPEPHEAHRPDANSTLLDAMTPSERSAHELPGAWRPDQFK